MNCQHITNTLSKEIFNVRKKKIRILRKKITSGKYAVNSREIAKALFPTSTEEIKSH